MFPSLLSLFFTVIPVFSEPFPHSLVLCGMWWWACPSAARRPSLPYGELWPSGSCGESGSQRSGVSGRSVVATAMLRFPDEARWPGEDVEEEMVPLWHGPPQTGVLHRWGTSPCWTHHGVPECSSSVEHTLVPFLVQLHYKVCIIVQPTESYSESAQAVRIKYRNYTHTPLFPYSIEAAV